jgi:hypothetical protein
MTRQILDVEMVPMLSSESKELILDIAMFLLWPYWLVWHCVQDWRRYKLRFDFIDAVALLAAIVGLCLVTFLLHQQWWWALGAAILYFLIPALVYLILLVIYIVSYCIW